SNGYDESVRERASAIVSFSRLTFPHQLFRVIALEQIYRAMKILNGERYRK
ncbi:MAG: 23S rRNA (pseudouridine(1915)-N(3))-methyltransferase RlmH, partial [Clostridiales bacterium]|nr:23S rRNA (pseudouridine(1915)-N(3))-methyltransferase RlmH [Clostridiales bacterium]